MTGVATSLLEGLRDRGGVSDLIVTGDEHGGRGMAIVTVDPEAVKATFDAVVFHAAIDVMLGASIIGVERSAGAVIRVHVVDFGGHQQWVEAAAVVDATGDASLVSAAGASVSHGTGGRPQKATMGVRYGGIPRDADVSVVTVGAAVRAAQRRGVTGLSSSSGFVVRLPVSHDVVAYLANEDVDALDARAFAAATRDARGQAWRHLDILRTLPSCNDAYIVSTGPELGIRQARHMVSRVAPADAALVAGSITDDTVAVGAWPSEYHPGAGRPSQWQHIGDDGAYGLTLDNLRSVDAPNLFGAGRVLGGERVIAASARVMGTALATGRAAGVAAAQASDGCHDADLLRRTRKELRRQGATLELDERRREAHLDAGIRGPEARRSALPHSGVMPTHADAASTTLALGWARRRPDSSAMTAPRVFSPVYVASGALGDAVAAYSAVLGVSVESRLPMPELGVTVVALGGVVIIGHEHSAEVIRVARVVLVADLDRAAEQVLAAGMEITLAPMSIPPGRLMHVRAADGAIDEWLEYRPLPGELAAATS